MIDYHIHYHAHGESGAYALERLEEMHRIARARGVFEIGLSEHIFRFVEFRDVVGSWWEDTDDSKHLKAHCERYFAEHATQSIGEYLDLVQRARQAGLPIVAGVELDYYPGRMDDVATFLAGFDLDFVLGSVHWIGAWGFDNEEVEEEWKRRDPDDVYETYFELLLDLARCGTAQILAHPDLVKKFGYRSVKFDLRDAFARVVAACAETGVGLEVSSAGWRMPVQEQYPASGLIESAVDGGVQLTTSSDAHVPELIGYKFDQLYDLVRGFGCDAVYGYRRKKPIRYSLDLAGHPTDRPDSHDG
jgi:histidinol-phosphatase (PHP family)